MKLKVVACGVFEPELRALIADSPHEVDLQLLDAGLHERPDHLRREAQAAIDAASDADAVVLVYGLCGRGTAGLIARRVPVVLPRVHDCLTLFLGSRAEYRRQFSSHPGTFYLTAGWYEKKVAPQGRQPVSQVDSRPGLEETDPRFRAWADRYGEDNARAIVYFYDSWKRNYTRAAFIDTGLDDRSTYAAYAQDMAREFAWEYARLEGHTELLRALLEGDWDRPDLVVLQPGQRSTTVPDERLLIPMYSAAHLRGAQASQPASEKATAPQAGPANTLSSPRSTLHDPRSTPEGQGGGPQDPPPVAGGGQGGGPPALGLGLDAGGTFTDCVLFDFATDSVLAKAKAPTTHRDLLIGIDQALSRLELTDPERITMVALSTTLATNAIAEDKGGLPGAILMTPDGKPDPRITWTPQRTLSACMSITGEENAPFDEAECRQAIEELLAAGVEAFAVCGYASVRNPAHEQAVRRLIAERCDLPVVCGHELAHRLNYLNHFNTAVLNARLLPVIRHLLGAAREVLAAHGITAPLMVVRGDGTLMTEEWARERPVETVLSGPAASVAGASYLTGRQDALVVDMGGTTTDVALVERGSARVSQEGARVAGWQTSVAAADIQTAGLGGDSYVQFTPDRRLQVGPRRVVPLCSLAAEHPSVLGWLERLAPEQVYERSSAAILDFFAGGRAPSRSLSDYEQRLLAALSDGPLPRVELSRRLRLASPLLLYTDNLERLGYLQRSALTPTDVLHARGEFTAWSVPAATRALELFADLYGRPAPVVAEMILQEVVLRLGFEALRYELGEDCMQPGSAARRLLQAALDRRPLGGLNLRLDYAHPLVAIGAPVASFFPQVGELLQAQVIIPPHAEVANAIGAVVSGVTVREQGLIRPGQFANYVLHWREGLCEFESLAEAIDSGRHLLADLAVRRATQAGAAQPQVQVQVHQRQGYAADGQQILVEVRLEAAAAGRPTALVPT
jgi:N-methylhydantoinase A/oxoprolinase/acetone carboxylase beta subunit